MQFFAHRGNLRGPQPDRENDPRYIDAAIDAGFSVECDLRFHDGNLYLGHDVPQYDVDEEWIRLRRNHILIHAKNVGAALAKLDCHYFCHAEDSFALTSRGMLWLHGHHEPNERCIVPLIDEVQVRAFPYRRMAGVCSDHVTLCREIFG